MTNDINQLQKFIKLVAELRNAQKDFYKTRSGLKLKKSKALEKRVDDELRQVLEIDPHKDKLHLFL